MYAFTGSSITSFPSIKSRIALQFCTTSKNLGQGFCLQSNNKKKWGFRWRYWWWLAWCYASSQQHTLLKGTLFTMTLLTLVSVYIWFIYVHFIFFWFKKKRNKKEKKLIYCIRRKCSEVGWQANRTCQWR